MKRVPILVDNAVRLRIAHFDKPVLSALKLKFTFSNPDFSMARLLKLPGWWRTPEFVETFEEIGDYLVIPRGGLRHVRDVLEDADIGYKLIDRRSEGGPVEKFPQYIGHELRYYQEEAISAAITRENCVLRLPTGSGKSVMAIALTTRVKLNTLVILPTVGLFNQWCQDARESLKMRADDLGIIHRKKRTLRPLTAAVQGTLASHGIDSEMREFFGMIIVDEAQKSAARTFMAVVEPFPARYRIGISADERRKDRKEYLTNGLFGGVAYEKKRKELEAEGFIVDVEIRVVPTDFEAPWYGLADDSDKEDERELDFKRLIDEMVGDEARNKLAMRFALGEAENDQQVIMLSHRREHCIELDREFVKHGIRSGFFIGGPENEKEFEKTRAGIRDKTVRVGIGTYGALGVGVNLPAVSVGVATTPIAGNRFNFNQVRGRLNRSSKGKNTSSTRLYVLWDRHVYPSHLKNMIAWNPTVKVYSKGRWIEGRHYLKASKKVMSEE